MITLRHAFEAANMRSLVMKIIRGQYPPVMVEIVYLVVTYELFFLESWQKLFLLITFRPNYSESSVFVRVEETGCRVLQARADKKALCECHFEEALCQ